VREGKKDTGEKGKSIYSSNNNKIHGNKFPFFPFPSITQQVASIEKMLCDWN
jgi:hypothetical protein